MPLTRLHRSLVCILVITAIIAAGLPARAGVTDACHCFRQRDYDPKRPFAADDYILTTSFNSLTAAWFGIPKKTLVRYKMKGGIGQVDLMIALALSRERGIDPGRALSMRQKAGDWKKAITALPGLKQGKGGDNRIVALLRQKDPAAVARILTDEMLAAFYRLPAARIETLRAAGCSEKEIALLLVLEKEKKIPAAKLLEQVRKEGRSWSEIAFCLGITPKEAGRMILNLHDR